jgi:hypothetical protein
VQALLLKSELKELGPDPDHTGVMRYQTGNGGPDLWIGAHNGTFTCSVPHAPMGNRDTFADAGLPSGSELLAGARLNFSNLQAIMGMAEMADPKASTMLNAWGLMGPDAMDFVAALGGKGDAMHLAGRVTNYGTHFDHFIPADGITKGQMQRIPKNAACATLLRLDIATYMSSVIQMMADTQGPSATDQLQQACQMAQSVLGVDVHQDILAPLGDAISCYMSDDTGGNGITSGICMISLKDAKTMASTIDTIRRSLDQLAAKELQGYLRVMHRDIQGCDTAVSLRFPGLPIPVEPTIAIARDQLIFGFFPQSVAAAVAQFDARNSLLDAEGFKQVGGHDGLGAVEVVYMDERLRATQGYMWMAFVASAIDNYTTSRSNPSKVAPSVLPTFNALTSDMRAGLFIARMDGDDMVMSGSADRSLVAQVTAGIGQLGAVAPMLIPFGVAMVAPAIESARRAARQASTDAGANEVRMASAQAQRRAAPTTQRKATAGFMAARRSRLETLATGLHLAQSKHADVQSLRDLVSGGFITRRELTVPGNPDARYMLVGGGALQTSDGEPCMIAEPSGLPIERLCITPKGQIASMSP